MSKTLLTITKVQKSNEVWKFYPHATFVSFPVSWLRLIKVNRVPLEIFHAKISAEIKPVLNSFFQQIRNNSSHNKALYPLLQKYIILKDISNLFFVFIEKKTPFLYRIGLLAGFTIKHSPIIFIEFLFWYIHRWVFDAYKRLG